MTNFEQHREHGEHHTVIMGAVACLDDADGDTIQTVIRLLGMTEQLTRQLVLSADEEKLQLLIDERMENNKKYPFNEGDEYWTLKENIFIWSFWDDVSKEFHDENPDTEYFTEDEVLNVARANGINL